MARAWSGCSDPKALLCTAQVGTCRGASTAARADWAVTTEGQHRGKVVNITGNVIIHVHVHVYMYVYTCTYQNMYGCVCVWQYMCVFTWQTHEYVGVFTFQMHVNVGIFIMSKL